VTAVPRSTQEILAHADDLAATFEDYDPSPDDEVNVAAHLLRRAALNRAPIVPPASSPDRRQLDG
jgi:hypothetical protein